MSPYDNELIRRRANSALETLLKSTFDVHVKLPQHAKCVIDVGHLIHVVHRPYQQVCESMSLTQYITKELSHLLCMMAMPALRQQKQVNTNAALLISYLLTFCLSAN